MSIIYNLLNIAKPLLHVICKILTPTVKGGKTTYFTRGERKTMCP